LTGSSARQPGYAARHGTNPAVWWIRDLGRSAGAEVDVRESTAIGRIARLVEQLRAARIA
jgi:hypothetical protein